ncbi:transposase [Stappia sp. F7233]|uniref:Transposase n=1 Tax=Stappia albiluteola TaxID=2758565 RepID=A0A839AB91_9HYPH|nr:transposase [Stappia albiluteola]MBA5775979.1 transposase [Stappia albiluteola]
MSVLSERYFRNEQAAYEFVEKQVWPKGPVCPHCHEAGNIRKLNGSSTRMGTYKCYHCLKPFTVKIGTVFEASRLPMHIWLQSIYLVAQSDRIMPAKELEEALGVSAKTAKVLAYRLHKAMYSSIDRVAPESGKAAAPRRKKSDLAHPVYSAKAGRRATSMRDVFLALQPA